MEYVNVSTTQNIDLEYKIASVGDRILAYLFDSLIISAWVITWFYVLIANDGAQVWHSVFAIPVLFYSLLCELFFNGQSFGKMVLKIKVSKFDGSELTFSSCLIRWILRIVDISLFSGFVAVITILVNGKGQRIGDLAAGTTVLKMSGKNLFENTTYMEVPDDYKLMYSQSEHLSDEDARIIKDVLLFVEKDNKSKGEIRDYHTMLLKTQTAFKTKLNINEVNGSAKKFLEDLLRDFNYCHR